MNKEQFLKYVNDFSCLSTDSLEEIKLLIDEFPHFQTAWVLYAKNLHKIQDVRLESKLKIAATHIGDRKVLKAIIDETNKPLQKSNKTETAIISPVFEQEKPEETKLEIQELIAEENPNTNIDKETIPETLDDTPEYKKIEDDFDEEEQNSDQNEIKEEETSVADLILKNISDINKSKSEKDEIIVQETIDSKNFEQASEQKETLEPDLEDKIESHKESEDVNIIPEQLISSNSIEPEGFDQKEEVLEDKVEDTSQDIFTKEEATNITPIVSEDVTSQDEMSSDTELIDDKPINEAKAISKPGSSAADRILQNIDDIKSGSVSERQTEQDFSNKSDLEQIIAQRLKELGIQQEEKSKSPNQEVKETIIESEKDVISEEINPNNDLLEEKIKSDNTENDLDILDINQFTSSKKEEKSEKNYTKHDLKSDDYLNFEFENELESEKSEKKIILNSDKKIALIDKFLSSDPRIVPQKDYTSNGSFATDSVLSEDEELFSETLAKIYIKQEHYDKAILTYEKLCLKYPEKNIYFVSQIEKIKELIKNK